MGQNNTISLKFNIWNYIYSKKLYIAAFVMPAFILLAVYLAFGIHPVGKESVLVLDLSGQYVYYFENLRDAFWGNGSFVNSFSRNLSGEMMGIFAYYLSSPYTLIVMLLPRSMILYSLLIMQLCKVGSAGLTFCLYLKKSRQISSYPSLIFSCLYALMAYMIVQLMNPMWLDALILLPVICYGIEKLIDKKKILWFTIPLTIMFIANFYIGWMVAIFCILYFIAYYFFLSEETLPFKIKHFLFAGSKFALGGVLSAGLSAWLLIPLYYSLTLGKFGFSNPKFVWETNFNVIDFFTNLLPNVYDTCRPEGSPVIYCGMLTIILVPMFLFNNNIGLRKKIGYCFLALVLFLSMYISNFDIAWHGFQNPNWLPYRYSFMFSFVLILMAAQAFERLEGISMKAIGAVMFLIIGWVFWIDAKNLDNVNVIFAVWYSVLLVCVYSLMLYLYKKKAKEAESSAGYKKFGKVILCAVTVELLLSSVYNMFAIDMDVGYSQYDSYKGYIELGRDTVDKIYDMDDDPFYRIEKTYHRSVNDALAFGSYGISHSSSTLNKAPIEFIRKLGFSYGGHYVKYSGSTYFTDDLFGIRYIMEKGSAIVDGDEPPIVAKSKHYDDLVLANGNAKDIFYVYKNEDALPLAFMVDSSFADVDISGENPFYNQNKLLSGLLDEDYTDYFKKIEIDDIIPENAVHSTYGNHDKYVPEVEGLNSHIEFLVTAPTTDMVYMYFPSSYERKVNLWLNDDFVDFYYEQGRKVIQPLGHFDAGEQFSLITTITEEKNEVLFKDNWFYYLDEEAYKKAIDELNSKPALEIDSFEEDHITGTVSADKDGILFTTMSYEPGWTILVDGVKTEPVELCDALIGVPVTAGNHTIEMKFFPQGLKLGIVISTISLAFLLVIIFFEIKRDKGSILLNKLYK